MKKLILKFWIINLLLLIGLFFIYRLSFTQTEKVERNFLEEIFTIMHLLLGLGISLLYTFVMSICSLTIFLNLRRNIREKKLLSLLTFLGIPFFTVLYIMVDFLKDFSNSVSDNMIFIKTNFTDFFAFPITHLILICFEFMLFRKLLTRYEVKEQ